MGGWLAVILLGFSALTALVIALGLSSTNRNHSEDDGGPATVTGPAAPSGDAQQNAQRNPQRGEHDRRPARRRPSGNGLWGGSRIGPAPADGPAVRGGAVATLRARAAAQVAVPATAVMGWWLLDVEGGGPCDPAGAESAGSAAVGLVVAGPFADRPDADWAAATYGATGLVDVRVVYGERRGDGTVTGRPAPAERAWWAGLDGQLDRLGEDWERLAGDSDALTTRVVEMTAALMEAGLPLYDNSDRARAPRGAGSPAGGVTLTPHPAGHGILISWRCHDRMSEHQERGAAADAGVRSIMNVAVAHVLTGLGYPVERIGATGCHFLAT